MADEPPADEDPRLADLEDENRDLRVENARLQKLLVEAGPQDRTVAGKTAPSLYLTENVDRLSDRLHYLPNLVTSKGWDYALAYARVDLVAAFRALNLNPRRMTPKQHQEYDRLRRWLTDPPLFRLLAMPGSDHDLIRAEWLSSVDDLAVGLSIPEVWVRSVEVPYVVKGEHPT